MNGLNELDVVGIHFGCGTAYLCEVATHLGGVLYGDNKKTVERITRKFEHQKNYADLYLSRFQRHVFMFWSPYVPVGYITDHLAPIEDLQLVINHDYTLRIGELQEKARQEQQDTGNPAFRVLQILGALRKEPRHPRERS